MKLRFQVKWLFCLLLPACSIFAARYSAVDDNTQKEQTTNSPPPLPPNKAREKVYDPQSGYDRQTPGHQKRGTSTYNPQDPTDPTYDWNRI